MLTLNKNLLVVVRFSAERGRSYVHVDDGAPVCLTCQAVGAESTTYSASCEGQGHRKQRKVRTTVSEDAPAETRLIGQLYSRLYSTFRSLGYACGQQVYLLSADQQATLDAEIAKLRKEFDDTNAQCQVCQANFFVKIVSIAPDASHEETLRSVKADVEAGVKQLTDALEAADLDKIKTAVKETKGLAGLLAGESKGQVAELSRFSQAIARRLRDAADAGEDKIAEVVAESRQGATRFAAILADEAEAVATA